MFYVTSTFTFIYLCVTSTFTKTFGMQWSVKFQLVRESPITSRIDCCSCKKENSAHLIYVHKATCENILTTKITQSIIVLASMHQDIDQCFILVPSPICQMTTSIDSLYKYTTTTSISILTLIQCYMLYSYTYLHSLHIILYSKPMIVPAKISNLQSNMSLIVTTKVKNAAMNQTRQQ